MTTFITIVFILLFVVCIGVVVYFSWQAYHLDEDNKVSGIDLFYQEFNKIKSQRRNGD